jgi:hypothetical protein
MKEVWKSIKGYEGIYEISNTGKIRSLERICNNRLLKAKPLKQCICSSGYNTILLSINGNKKRHLVHRLVIEAFYGKSKLTVNHIDSNKLNNNIDNLEYLSQRENSNHYFKNPLHNIRKTPSGKYQVEMRVNGIIKYLGIFKTTSEAIIIRDNKLEQLKQINK